jgi:uncharacterized protein
VISHGAEEEVMTAEQNKKLMQVAMDALSRGDRRPFGELMADDFVWTFPGKRIWSGSYRGKAEVRARLLGPLFEQFAGVYVNTPLRLIAEGDIVVVECRGEVTTKKGERYDNSYCYVCRFEGGKLRELTEYMDTALAEAVLDPPRERLAHRPP